MKTRRKLTLPSKPIYRPINRFMVAMEAILSNDYTNDQKSFEYYRSYIDPQKPFIHDLNRPIAEPYLQLSKTFY
jgi:hypothetical protein